MARVKKSEELLAYIREGRVMTSHEKMRLIVLLSIPSILSQLSAVVMFLIDASMVGHLGTQQAASVGLMETSTWLLTCLLSATSMGFSVQVAHAIGANDFERARSILRQGMVCAMIVSLSIMLVAVVIHKPLPLWLGGGQDIADDASIYFLIIGLALPFFQYQNFSASMLKCSGNMIVPSIITVLGCVLDVVFNYFFIFVLELGVPGAAFGTLTAVGIVSVILTYFLVYRSRHLCLRGHPGSFRLKFDCVKRAFNIGAPMALQQVAMCGAHIVTTVIIAPLGNISIAANSFAINIESICYMPGYGIAEAATTLVGQGIGAGQRLLTRSFARMSVGLGIITMSLLAILMFIFSYDMMSLMTPIEAIRSLGSDVLRIEAFAEPFFAAQIVCYGVFLGAGDTLKPALMNLFSIWGVRITISVLLASQYGLKGVWFAMMTELVFRGTIFLIRFFRGGWYKTMLGKP